MYLAKRSGGKVFRGVNLWGRAHEVNLLRGKKERGGPSTKCGAKGTVRTMKKVLPAWDRDPEEDIGCGGLQKRGKNIPY